MTKIIIGCDPDVDGKGYATFVDGKLLHLHAQSLIELYGYIESMQALYTNPTIELHIENLNGNKSSAFNHRNRQAKAVQNKISESVGRCKQVQIEVERIAEYFGVKVARHKVSSRWKDAAGKKEFERVTGWTERSNPDTRSAAYFGYLGTKQKS